MPATSDTHYADLLLQGSDEILLLIDGQSLHILALNDAALHQLGYAREAMIGQPVGEFECALSDMFFWDELQGKASVVGVESALRCADGRVLDVAKSVFRVSEQPLRYTLRAVPVASHNRIETELANMGSRLRATLEATADGILLMDSDGTIINMNRRFSTMWGLPESLLINRDDAGIMAFLAAQRIPDVGSQLSQHGIVEESHDDADEDDEFETQYLKDGRVFECRVHSAHAGEEVIGRVHSYRDVTERYRTQRELIHARDEAKRASAAKGDFLAMMSHEIRTPMNGVLGIAELLAGTALDDEQGDYVRVIRSSGETLLAILNDILDYSKIEAGKLSLERTRFSLPGLLEELIALFRFRLREGGPSFECAIDGDVPVHLLGDPVRLRQILFNLVGNAFKFTETGRIDVRVTLLAGSAPASSSKVSRCDTARVRFAVRDTGIGLTPEQCGRLFQSFEQADSSTTRKYGGTGLGLAICKRLAELMDGDIGVSSTPGAGSEFWFTASLGVAESAAAVPASVVKPADELAKPGKAKSSQANSPAKAVQAVQAVAADAALPLTPATRVLLVEDNLINRKVMAGMLKKLGGSEPAIAGDGQEAVTKAMGQRFDLILMDTQMPVMDGLEATRRLRAAGLTIPIIGVSAGALEEERQAALDAGVNDYVLKPVNLVTLGAALQRALQRAPARS